MFDPEAAKKRKEGKSAKREAQYNIKQWVLEALSEDMRADVETRYRLTLTTDMPA